MNVHVRASFTLFLSILSSPHLRCPRHHWATVEVVSGRGMMPNLTGVEPYLYSLHSRFCFKGFVYTRPINHLLPSNNPTAFKVGARPGDNVQHRCQCKSLFLLFLKEGNEDSKTSGHLLLSGFSIISSLLFPLALITISTYHSNWAPESSDYQIFKWRTPEHWGPGTWVYLAHQCHTTPFNPVPTADWHCPHVFTAKCECMQTGCCWANINHTTGSHRQRGRWRT